MTRFQRLVNCIFSQSCVVVGYMYIFSGLFSTAKLCSLIDTYLVCAVLRRKLPTIQVQQIGVMSPLSLA